MLFTLNSHLYKFILVDNLYMICKVTNNLSNVFDPSSSIMSHIDVSDCTLVEISQSSGHFCRHHVIMGIWPRKSRSTSIRLLPVSERLEQDTVLTNYLVKTLESKYWERVRHIDCKKALYYVLLRVEREVRFNCTFPRVEPFPSTDA